MTTNIIEEKKWLNQHWKWFIPLTSIIIAIVLFLSSGISVYIANFAQAYTDTELFEDALQKAQMNEKINELIGKLEPINKLAFLESEVIYSNNNTSVDLSIKIKGSKRRAVMDISADRISGEWSYKKINIRIKKPIEEKQTIEIIKNLE